MEKTIWTRLIKAGLTPAGAAGMMGNLYAESGLITGRVEVLCLKRLKEHGMNYNDTTYTAAVDNGTISRAEFLNPLPGKQYGYGLAQWTTPARKAGLYDLVKSRGVSISDIDAQVDYLLSELQNTYKSVWSTLSSTASIKTASDVVLTKFECPADQGTAVKNLRAGYGQKYYDKYKDLDINGGGSSMSYTVADAKKRVLDIARAEIGYLEKRSNSQLDDKTANAGSNNYTKYWRDVKPEWNGQAWCAVFVSWVLMQAFDKTTATKLLKHWPYVYCPDLGNRFTQYANPEVGDIVIFYRGGTFAHTGIVTSVVGDRFETIEGNTSGASGVIANGGGVCAKSYFNSKLPGTKFCRIDWNAAAAWMNGNLGGSEQKDFLCEGDQGEAVKSYQKNLIEIGYNCGKNGADGDFGPATKTATVEFQGDYGLEQDGNAGPATQAKLSAEVKKKGQTQKGFARFVGEVQKTCAVHEAAKKASPAITGYPKLSKGNLVDVLGCYGYQDGWYKVCIADEHIGYVWADSVKPVDAEAYKDNRTEQGFTRFVGEVQKTCVVHLKPKKASDAITGWPKLVKGNRVDILGRDGYEDNWYKVCVADQYIGYAWADSIKRV